MYQINKLFKFTIISFFIFCSHLLYSHELDKTEVKLFYSVSGTTIELEISPLAEFFNIPRSELNEEHEKVFFEFTEESKRKQFVENLSIKIQHYFLGIVGKKTLPAKSISFSQDDNQIWDFTLSWDGQISSFIPDPSFGSIVLDYKEKKKVYFPGERIDLNVERSILQWVYQGILHIIPLGLDHIVFVALLFFLSVSNISKLITLGYFTIGHTIGMGLGCFSIINISASIIEPLIAFTLLLMAFEAWFRGPESNKRKIFWIILFGLIHGQGFSLAFLDLNPSNILFSLILFGIGIDLGQIMILGIMIGLNQVFRRHKLFKTLIITASSCLSIFWIIERIF